MARARRAVLPALAREAVPALLAAGRIEQAAATLAALRPAELAAGRFRLLRARVLLAQGGPRAAREIFDEGFEIADLREGDEAIGDTWYAIGERIVAGDGPVTEDVAARARREHPLPERYECRMRPVRG
ncbi:hypothetical protein [Streptomyces sp. CT34]|uniref:hypothetical protein n=1 Tax=Streptomyces sp. CT34 TaxID=1553907 RepID=UPI0005B88C65